MFIGASNRIFSRIFTLGLAITLAFVGLFAWVFARFKDDLYENKRVKTRHLVESACSILEDYALQAKTTELTVNEARTIARETLRHMRYDRSEYFFIADTRGVMIMHPFRADKENTDWSGMQDPTGKFFIAEMARVARENGEGFVNYYWARQESAKPVPKITYVKLFPEWQWVVGSGIYVDDVEKEASQMLRLLVAIGAVLVIAGAAASFCIARGIALPLKKAILTLNEQSQQTASAAAQVANASQQLSQGATEQAASLEETSSSLSAMSSMTRRNADNTGVADRLAQEAKSFAQQGDRAMQEMSAAMGSLGESSGKISKIIKSIEEIAFQTNLLALNAAVEAARAGEQGKGFAVVAQEVRNLAHRCSASAKDTASLIEESIEKTRGGSEIARKAAETIDRIQQSNARVAQIISEISAASKEQAEGISQVANAISQMDQVTQQNASAAENSASASQQLSAQAESLKKVIGELQGVIGAASAVH